MSEPKQTTALALADKAREIDRISSTAMAVFGAAESFEKELVVAQAMGDLRLALTPEVMKPVMDLMNTDLGFRTDRDPNITPTDKNGHPMKPYSVEVVRECFIEARLRGFHTVGNEFNIISGRFYACKNGIRRKVTVFPGVTDFKDSYEVPRVVGEKGAIVKCKATWRKEGVPDSLEAEIPVRVNFGMGADAILGKAERKLLKRVLDRLSGIITPEGEVGDDAPIDVKATVQPAAEASELFKGKPAPTPAQGPQATPEVAKAGIEAAKQAAETAPEPKPAAAPAPAPKPQKPHQSSKPVEPCATKGATPQQELAEFVTMNGFTFDNFVAWAKANNTLDNPDSLTSFDDVPAEKARRWATGAKEGLLRGLRVAKGN